MNGNGFKRKARGLDASGWALTLADMMTLLLCFFILMVSVGQVDREQYEAMSEVFAKAMGGKGAPAEVLIEDGTSEVRSAAESRKVNLFALQLELSRMLKGESENVSLSLQPRAVAISLKNNVLFPSGSASLEDSARSLLLKIERPLADTGYSLTIEGHTDDVPIATDRYPSNWELSSARAAAVARFFIDEGFKPERIQIKGLADTRPLAPNLDAAGEPIEANRAQNRRVVILVHPE